MIRNRDLYHYLLDESAIRPGFGAWALLRAYRNRVARLRMMGGAA